ncbi:hypothetical protein FOA52_011232 [Chlamydomonas sp. UWO 241]|nr:hypothetical protein FOA52_011232 [Chlamydomonas sp. UWO 241]
MLTRLALHAALVLLLAAAHAGSTEQSWHTHGRHAAGTGTHTSGMHTGASTAGTPHSAGMTQPPATITGGGAAAARTLSETDLPFPKAAIEVNKIAVLGERHSGTNFMKAFLTSNFPQFNVSEWFCENKHKYQSKESNLCDWNDIASTIVVVMFRNPYDWALGMHRKCYCGEPGPNQRDEDTMANLTFDDFMTRKWMDNKAKVWTGGHKRTHCRHIMECRALQHLNFLNMTRWARFVEFVRHEDVLQPKDSLQWVNGFAERYGLDRSHGFRTETQYKGAAGSHFDAGTLMDKSVWFNPELTAQDPVLRAKAELISAQMDLAVESMVGYLPRAWALPGGGEAAEEGEGGAS